MTVVPRLENSSYRHQQKEKKETVETVTRNDET